MKAQDDKYLRIVTSQYIDRVGQKLERRYGLLDKLGDGTFGVVYKARDLNSGHVRPEEMSATSDVVALKYFAPIDPAVAADRMIDRFIREAELMRGVDHDNIIRFHCMGRDEKGQIFYVMEYLPDSRCLSDLVESKLESRSAELKAGKINKSLFDYQILFPILRQILLALVRLQENRPPIVHRDLKPENLLVIDREGKPHIKLIDFGIAKALELTDTGSKALRKLTRTGEAYGTPNYMAPEQIATLKDPDTNCKWSVGPWSDVWAFGVIAYELVTGNLPFSGESFQDIFGAISQEPVEPLAKHVDNPNPALESMILSCLTKQPWQRPQSATDVLKLLETTERVCCPSAFEADDTHESKPPPSSLRVVGEPRNAAATLHQWRQKALLVSMALILIITFGYWGLSSFFVGNASKVAEMQLYDAAVVVTSSATDSVLSVATKTVDTRNDTGVALRSSVAQEDAGSSKEKRKPGAGPDPNGKDAKSFERGLTYYKTGNCLLAKREMYRALILYPSFPKSLEVLAECFYQEKNLKKAKEYVLEYEEFQDVPPLPQHLRDLLKD